MTRSRRRSPFKVQERWARRFVRLSSHQDRELAESVNVLSQRDIQDALAEHFDGAFAGVPRLFDEGEILSDARREGTQDKVIDDDER